ncbi:replication factor A protein 3 [Wolfiporia cocos MD-104 SS10]|uniref:Replication factor A protein 3 n=1 Tax=Wolfiporia cocos (strain MD-104) TaxID=742152 RepID=A0A2H3IYX1_WOLCO|nr:replication factor A protein 3 [Wolfiporia cocos MD-104 SS10]
MSELVSPRVNAARIGDYIGRTVRLTGKIVKTEHDTLILQASDGGEVQVRLLRDADVGSPYIEVIGSVLDASTLKMQAFINLGENLDMKLVNDVVELWHDPRFSKMFL